MGKPRQKVPQFRFLTAFLLPSLLIFLVPVLSFFFFRHAQGRFDDDFRESILKQVSTDPKLTPEDRARAVAFFTEVPFSELLENEQFAARVSADTRFYYATFRWMIYIAAGSILAGAAVFLLAGVCVALSLHSQYVQYLSLSAGWHVLRVYGALQTVAQGVLLVALSFWVTALWTKTYSIKLIVVTGLLAVGATIAVIVAIFRPVKDEFSVAGQALAPDEAAPIWGELRRICALVGTDPPDQIVAGIDDNFFVTEHPVTVGDKTYRGRTLFVSLSLLKQLQGGEADAVLAHEMAHFSGQDTLYSKKISPLLSRYGHYLEALHGGGVTVPIYYYMLCFRALYQLSLRRLSRQREFRADRVALEATSVRDMAGALLRTVAYSKYREDVERDLFKHERALESANVSERIEQGFPQYAARFVSGPDIGQLAPAHPFDSHPPLAERLQALGLPLDSTDAHPLLAAAGNGQWYRYIPAAEQIEREQWQHYEEQFRLYHAQSLPYRFLPETAEEREIVVSAFPPLTFASSDGTLALDHDQMAFDPWPEPIRYAEIAKLFLDDKGVLKISCQAKRGQSLKPENFANWQGVLYAIQQYYGRYLAAAEYQKQKREEAASGARVGPD
jgi:Zn-dependent protease with chaperone function